MNELPTTPAVRFCCVDIASGRTLLADGEQLPLYPASTLKLAILIAVHRAVDASVLELTDRLEVTGHWQGITGAKVTMRDGDADPVMRSLTGTHTTVANLCERMIVVSSNEASNILIDRLGMDAINAAITDVGASHTSLRHHFGDRAAWGTATANVTTGADLARIASAIANGKAASARGCATMLELLLRQEHRDLIPAALPAGVECANKPGDADGVVHDVAIVRRGASSGYALAVCACDYPRPELAQAAIRERAAAVHRFVTARWVEARA